MAEGGGYEKQAPIGSYQKPTDIVQDFSLGLKLLFADEAIFDLQSYDVAVESGVVDLVLQREVVSYYGLIEVCRDQDGASNVLNTLDLETRAESDHWNSSGCLGIVYGEL